MKKVLFVFFIVFIILFAVVSIFLNREETKFVDIKSKVEIENAGDENINIKNTIKYWDYIDSVNEKEDWDNLKLDERGNAVYNGKTVLSVDGFPLNDEYAVTPQERRIMYHLRGIKPREGCDPYDIATNGVMGCYMEPPENYSEANANWLQLRDDIYLDTNSIKKGKHLISAWFKIYDSNERDLFHVDSIPVHYELIKYEAQCFDSTLDILHSKSFDVEGNLLEDSYAYNGVTATYDGYIDGEIYFNALCNTKKRE